jgi:hypothetical protein
MDDVHNSNQLRKTNNCEKAQQLYPDQGHPRESTLSCFVSQHIALDKYVRHVLSIIFKRTKMPRSKIAVLPVEFSQRLSRQASAAEIQESCHVLNKGGEMPGSSIVEVSDVSNRVDSWPPDCCAAFHD